MNKIKSIKYLFLAFLMAMGLALTGCDLLGGDDEDTVEILNFDLSSVSVDVSDGNPDTIRVVGEIDASADITVVDVVVTDSATGEEITEDDGITVKKGSMTGSKNADLDIILVVEPATLTKRYTVKVTASTENGDATESASFYVTGFTGTPVVETQVVLGAQNATQGSALDLDDYSVYTSSQVTDNEATVDLYLGFAQTGNALRIMSPAEAATDGFAPQNWPAGTTNETRFYQLETLTAAEFNAITRQEDIDVLWDPANALSQAQLNISGGEVIIVETDQDLIRIIRVDNVSSETASAVVTIIGYN
jgi:hypothetical protein